jgi:GntR family transcriptional regulator
MTDPTGDAGVPPLHKYERVAQAIRRSILGSLSPHDALPSERELTAAHGVSRMTVRHAIASLVEEGLLYNVHGSGTYVGSPGLLTRAPKLTSFSEDMARRGYEVSSRVLEFGTVSASEEVAVALRVVPGSPCTHLRRLRLADEHPMALEDVYLPQAILADDQFDRSGSLYERLRELGHEVFRAEEEIQGINLDAASARLLDVTRGAAALRVTRVSSSRRGQVIEFARTIYRADRYSFQVVVTRDAEK